MSDLDTSPSGRIAELSHELERLRAELRNTQAQAQEASSDRTRFIAAASHDLLQPLNAARLYTATLVEQAQATPYEQLAHRIEASLAAVEEIMTALLDISRLDSGAVEPAIEPFGAQQLLDRVLVEFTPLAREQGVRLRVARSSGTVLSDPKMVGRIVRNLVSNAIKYTPAGGHVLVGSRRRGQNLRIDVVDTGIGIAPAQQSLIFGEFTRLDAGAKIARGLGLGLSIVQRLVATLELTLDVASEPGHGSRFSLLLPLAAERPATAAPAARVTPGDLAGLHILCVDNEPEILGGMQTLLGGWGCDVRTAVSLKALVAENLLSLWLPDVILMDYHLGQTSGLDAIEWLRQNVGGHVPAALLTADRSETVRRLAAARNVPILHKPIKPAALRAMVTSLSTTSAG